MSKKENESRNIVYKTNTGKKYHTKGCGYLRSSIPIKLSEAIKIYSPCSRCNPPINVQTSPYLYQNNSNQSTIFSSANNTRFSDISSVSRINNNESISNISFISNIHSRNSFTNSFIQSDNQSSSIPEVREPTLTNKDPEITQNDEKLLKSLEILLLNNDNVITIIKKNCEEASNNLIKTLENNISKLNYEVNHQKEKISLLEVKNTNLQKEMQELKNEFNNHKEAFTKGENEIRNSYEKNLIDIKSDLFTEINRMKEIENYFQNFVISNSQNDVFIIKIKDHISNIEKFLNIQSELNKYNKEKLNYLIQENFNFKEATKEIKSSVVNIIERHHDELRLKKFEEEELHKKIEELEEQILMVTNIISPKYGSELFDNSEVEFDLKLRKNLNKIKDDFFKRDEVILDLYSQKITFGRKFCFDPIFSFNLYINNFFRSSVFNKGRYVIKLTDLKTLFNKIKYVNYNMIQNIEENI